MQIVSEDPTDLLLRVFFNTTEAAPLVEGEGFDAAKWTARRNNLRFNAGNVAWFDFNCIEVALQQVEANEGEDELSYSNAPSDIADTLGRQLAAFEGFPL